MRIHIHEGGGCQNHVNMNDIIVKKRLRRPPPVFYWEREIFVLLEREREIVLLVDTSRTNTTSSAALYENPRTGRTPSHRRLATDVTPPRAPREVSRWREELLLGA